MTKEDIALKLAAITGKPVEGFFNESNKQPEADVHSEIEIESEPDVHVSEVECDTKESTDEEKRKPETTPSEEVLAFQKMFAGSKIVNGKILNGRQMTRKEYLKYTKNLTYDEYFEHPLMYKMFRAEGQVDPSFMTFPNKFPKVEQDEDQE